MVTSCTGHVLDNQRATTRGVFSSGSHLVTLHFQPHPFFSCVTDAVNGAHSRFSAFYPKANYGLQGSQPLMFVRIIALPTARVMNTNNSRCSPWEDKKQ